LPNTKVICPEPAAAEAIAGASGVSWATTEVFDALANDVHDAPEVLAYAEQPTVAIWVPLVGIASTTMEYVIPPDRPVIDVVVMPAATAIKL
jgi:hypothetical protein